MTKIEHCSPGQKTTSVYRMTNFREFGVLFIFEGTCNICGNVFYNTVGFDTWGTIRTPSVGKTVVAKKLKYQYREYIRVGLAVKVDNSIMDYRNTKGGMVGVGEWTMTVKSNTANIYQKILKRYLKRPKNVPERKKYKLYDAKRKAEEVCRAIRC